MIQNPMMNVKIKKLIMNSINSLFPNADVQSFDDVNDDDGYGQKALKSDTYYTLDFGEVWIQCVTWGKITKRKPLRQSQIYIINT